MIDGIALSEKSRNFTLSCKVIPLVVLLAFVLVLAGCPATPSSSVITSANEEANSSEAPSPTSSSNSETDVSSEESELAAVDGDANGFGDQPATDGAEPNADTAAAGRDQKFPTLAGSSSVSPRAASQLQISQAEKEFASSLRHQKAGRHAEAYQAVLKAWNLVQGSQQEQSQQYGQKYWKQMTSLAEQLDGSKFPNPDPSRPLILE